MRNRGGNNGNRQTSFLRTPKSLTRVIAASKFKKKKKKSLLLERKAMTNVDSILKNITLPKMPV